MAFWSAALDAKEEPLAETSRSVYRRLKLPDPDIRILLQQTGDAKTHKDRMHFDAKRTTSTPKCVRLEGLGATRYEHEQERGYDFWVMRDPGATSSASCIRTSPLSHYDRGRGPSLSKTATERVDVIAAYTKKRSRRHRRPAPDAAGSGRGQSRTGMN